MIILSGLVAVVLLSGTCAAGFIAGRVTTPTPTPEVIVQSIPAPAQEPAEAQPPAEQPQPAEPQPARPAPTSPPIRPPSGTPTDLEELFAPFWEAWYIIQDQYVDQPVDSELLMRGAITGMLEALGDQHTSYMDPDQFRQASTPLEGEYEGIGAWVDADAEFLTIVSPMPDSPAEAAGLKPGDQIIAVDGESVIGVDGNLVIRRVLGPSGTKVVLTIRRESVAEPFDVEITRARIVIPSVEGRMLDNNLAYVQLFTFGENTDRDLRDTLRTLLAERPSGLILDLRNNGGGFLNTAIQVASEFIQDGVVMYEEYGDGSRDTFRASGSGLATKIPLVVLVNEGTASASEIVAGAIQDYGRGQLVGVTTFGKGSVQNWVSLKNDQGAVRVTIARWLTPDERQINEVGLQPDVVVELTEEDVTAERDPQLDQAIEILLGQVP
jgi:carboxyl-terminal processing protease